MIIIMFGEPGVGKGTIAELLVKKHKMKIISASGLLKKEISKKTKNAKIIENHILTGKLVSSEIIMPLILNEIKKYKSKNIIIDGFPRNVDQAKEIMSAENIKYVIDLKTSEKIILERLSGRRICPKCKTIYHIKHKPPKRKDICDKDNTKLIQRKDDKPKIIKDRLKVYRKETKPLEKYFIKLKKIKKIDASGKPENIVKLIEKNISFK